MKCPNDGATLVMSERSGVEIDYCPECRGVWLDRGELDKIIDRADAAPAAAGGYPSQVPPAQVPPMPPTQPYGAPQFPTPSYGDQRYGSSDGYYRKKKKDNWLSELFD
ncbi:zf-TFIIB domain-containing protein [Lysobacter korlensis]|uniref:Zf-TFIIB domain-containing protein n=1 Tax=Lysobacter korlensis TaxID=553636 RepID=A0ABV6RMX7_9GAMM